MKIYLLLLIGMVFVSGCTGQNVGQMDSAKFTSMELDTGMEWNANPSFSPDDKKIVFETGFGVPDIYVLDIQTKKITKVIATEAEESGPAFSPDGKAIILSSGGNITIINLDGTSPMTLTNTSDDYSPRFSPDGKKILFSSFRNGSELWTMDTNGNNPKQLTDFGFAWMPEYSPDGKKIVFAIGRKIPDSMYTSNEIAIINSDGAGPKILTDETTQSVWPEFSADGQKIVFHSVLESGLAIRMINVDGTGLVQLKEKYNTVGSPSFSHDGKKLAYISRLNPHLLIVKNVEDLEWESIK